MVKTIQLSDGNIVKIRKWSTAEKYYLARSLPESYNESIEFGTFPDSSEECQWLLKAITNGSNVLNIYDEYDISELLPGDLVHVSAAVLFYNADMEIPSRDEVLEEHYKETATFINSDSLVGGTNGSR